MRLELPNRRLRLAFFGTPAFAQTILEALIDADQDDVVFVACQPDKPKGRGKKLIPPPVKETALARGIELIQPSKMKDGAVAAALLERNLDLAIVAAFGRILPPAVLEAPAAGFWNVHASLLPKYRGASPIHHAILSGDAETGVTLMQVTPGLDEGPMLAKASTPILPEDTTEALTPRLAELGGRLLVEGIALAKSEGLEVTPQDDAEATFAPLIDKDDGRLDVAGGEAAALARQVRAFHPWPGTFVELGGQRLKIIEAEAIEGEGSPGTVAGLGKTLDIQTAVGRLRVRTLQPPGKKPMPAAAYLNGAGRGLTVGQAFDG